MFESYLGFAIAALVVLYLAYAAYLGAKEHTPLGWKAQTKFFLQCLGALTFIAFVVSNMYGSESVDCDSDPFSSCERVQTEYVTQEKRAEVFWRTEMIFGIPFAVGFYQAIRRKQS